MRTVACRLRHGEDIYESLQRIAREERISAACVVCMVGCVTKARIRRAGGDGITELDGPLEIVSVTGTVSRERTHVHVSFSDREYRVWGGHMKEGCIVDTTAELVLLVMDDIRFLKEFDESTGYHELKIQALEE